LSDNVKALCKHPDWESGLIIMSWADAVRARLSRDEYQETLGLSRAREFLSSRQFTAHDLAPILLLQLHEVLMATPYSCGSEFRHGSVKVVIAGSCHLPPVGVHVASHVNAVFDNLMVSKTSGDDPFRVAAIALWSVDYVHPFGDGNGRVAVALAMCVLLVFGVHIDVDEAIEGIRRRRQLVPILEILTKVRSNPLIFLKALDGLVSKLKQIFGVQESKQDDSLEGSMDGSFDGSMDSSLEILVEDSNNSWEETLDKGL